MPLRGDQPRKRTWIVGLGSEWKVGSRRSLLDGHDPLMKITCGSVAGGTESGVPCPARQRLKAGTEETSGLSPGLRSPCR